MKRTTSLWIGIVVVLVVTVVVTIASGHLFGRWRDYQGLEEARALLREMPMEINGWRAEEEGKLDNASVTMLQIQDSYLFRIYRNMTTQAEVRFTLMVGSTGRVTVHTPEVCFGGRDYEKESAPTRVAFEVISLETDEKIIDEFWRLDFVGEALGRNNRISFYYAVSAGDVWRAVTNTRSTFVRYPYAYRIQVEAYTGAGDNEDNVKKFLEDCLPTIHKHIRPCQPWF